MWSKQKAGGDCVNRGGFIEMTVNYEDTFTEDRAIELSKTRR